VCFVIGDRQGNDAILGAGAHKSSVSATSLVAGEDVGTAMAKGFGPKASLLRTHHIRKDKTVLPGSFRRDQLDYFLGGSSPFVHAVSTALDEIGIPPAADPHRAVRHGLICRPACQGCRVKRCPRPSPWTPPLVAG
jgi:hypothetical protein